MAVSNLTNTKWQINEMPNLISANFEINFVSNGIEFVELFLYLNNEPPVSGNIQYGSTEVYSDRTNAWLNEEYRTIEITGGNDAQSSTLIAWLTENAVQVGSDPLDKVVDGHGLRRFASKVKSAIAETGGLKLIKVGTAPPYYGTLDSDTLSAVVAAPHKFCFLCNNRYYLPNSDTLGYIGSVENTLFYVSPLVSNYDNSLIIYQYYLTVNKTTGYWSIAQHTINAENDNGIHVITIEHLHTPYTPTAEEKNWLDNDPYNVYIKVTTEDFLNDVFSIGNIDGSTRSFYAPAHATAGNSGGVFTQWLYYNGSTINDLYQDYKYTLPTASSTVKGGVKIGTGIDVASDGTISVQSNGQGDKVITISGIDGTISSSDLEYIVQSAPNVKIKYDDIILNYSGSGEIQSNYSIQLINSADDITYVIQTVICSVTLSTGAYHVTDYSSTFSVQSNGKEVYVIDIDNGETDTSNYPYSLGKGITDEDIDHLSAPDIYDVFVRYNDGKRYRILPLVSFDTENVNFELIRLDDTYRYRYSGLVQKSLKALSLTVKREKWGEDNGQIYELPTSMTLEQFNQLYADIESGKLYTYHIVSSDIGFYCSNVLASVYAYGRIISFSGVTNLFGNDVTVTGLYANPNGSEEIQSKINLNYLNLPAPTRSEAGLFISPKFTDNIDDAEWELSTPNPIIELTANSGDIDEKYVTIIGNSPQSVLIKHGVLGTLRYYGEDDYSYLYITQLLTYEDSTLYITTSACTIIKSNFSYDIIDTNTNIPIPSSSGGTTYSINSGSGDSVTLTASDGSSTTRYINAIYDMGAGSTNKARYVWFNDDTTTGKPVYDTTFTYNPATGVLAVNSVETLGRIMCDHLEVGSQSTPTVSYIDFHTDGTTADYNSRILATGKQIQIKAEEGLFINDTQITPADYAKLNQANSYTLEQSFTHSTYCGTIYDSANGLGCAYKGSRGFANQFVVGQILLPLNDAGDETNDNQVDNDANVLKFQKITGTEAGKITAVETVASLDGDGNLTLKGDIKPNGGSGSVGGTKLYRHTITAEDRDGTTVYLFMVSDNGTPVWSSDTSTSPDPGPLGVHYSTYGISMKVYRPAIVLTREALVRYDSETTTLDLFMPSTTTIMETIRIYSLISDTVTEL